MTPRVPKAELPTELRTALTEQLGAVPEPVEVLWNNPGIAEASQYHSAQVARWDAVDAGLKSFAHMAVAAQIGCSWCLDINYFLAMNQKLDPVKAGQVPRWRESDLFTPLERDVLEYAEAMTNTPTTVTDELAARLLRHLGAPALVELNAYIGYANMAARCNTAHGITSQGYSDSCEIPLAARPVNAGDSGDPGDSGDSGDIGGPADLGGSGDIGGSADLGGSGGSGGSGHSGGSGEPGAVPAA